MRRDDGQMFIAHLPSGYLLAEAAGRSPRWRGPGLMAAALAGAVFPDIDLLYFYFLDARQHHHRLYVTHWPILWAALAVIGGVFLALGQRAAGRVMVLFAGGALVHMVLDTFAAPLHWLAPVSERGFQLFEVPAHTPHWILSYLLHWTFLAEIAICAAAAGWFLTVRGAGLTKMVTRTCNRTALDPIKRPPGRAG